MWTYRAQIVFVLTILSVLINLFYFMKIKVNNTGFSRVNKSYGYLRADENYLEPELRQRENRAGETREVHDNKLANTSPSNDTEGPIVLPDVPRGKDENTVKRFQVQPLQLVFPIPGYEQKPTSNEDLGKAQNDLNNDALSSKDEKEMASVYSAYPKHSTSSRVNIVTVRKNKGKTISGIVSAEDYQPKTTLQRYMYSRNKKYKHAFTSTLKFNLTAVNLRLAPLLKQNPFDVWIFRNRFRSYEDIGLHEDPSIRGLHLGNPNRLKNVILKAIQGKTIEVVVIGGSNSAGGGIDKDEKSLKGLYFNMFVDWWSKIVGDSNESKVNIQNLAIGGTGSGLFTFCFRTFLYNPDDFDIVFVETAVNFDQTKSKSPAEPAEQLARVLLSSPSAPAVMFINLVSGLGKDPITRKTINPTCGNLEDYGLVEIARHYKITTFSLRDIVCRKIRKKRHIAIPNMASSDCHHIGIRAHCQLALMLINYTIDNLREVLHDLQKRTIEENVETTRFEIAKIPATLLIKKTTAIVSSPLCWTAATPNRFQKVYHPSLNLKAAENRGFVLHDKTETKTLRTDSRQKGWVALYSGNLIRFNFNVPSWRYSSKIHSRSVIIVILTSGHGGVGEVCIDNVQVKTNCKRVDSKSKYGTNKLHPVATRVDPGKHSLTVKIVRKGMFMVNGILIGPPDF